ncbi:unnamed protein product [Ascophyllum nodosum]
MQPADVQLLCYYGAYCYTACTVCILAPRRPPSSRGISAINADAGKLGTKLYHSVNLVILAGLPAALATSPSALTMPLDTVMGLAMPLHAHIGMNYVITDYVHKPFRGLARGAMLTVSVLAAVGLLKLNLSGAGLTETLKATWRGGEGRGPQKKNKDKEV